MVHMVKFKAAVDWQKLFLVAQWELYMEETIA